MIGANPESIELAEDRQKFKDAMREIGLKCPESIIVKELSKLEPSATGGLNILNSSVEKNQNTQFSTLSLKISRDQKLILA